MKLAVPDLVSPSYFPVVAAVELGFFKAEGLDVALELIFPIDAAYRALRDGAVDFVGGSAHAALSVFPEWNGVKLLCAQAQGMYWFLVMHADLRAERGDLQIVKGRRIGASPWVDMGLRALLEDAGIDVQRDNVQIAPVPRPPGRTVNFGVTAAKRLEERVIDGFWANGMGAEIAERGGFGTVVIDVRRDGPKSAFDCTFGALAATDTLIARAPETAAAAVRAVVAAQRALAEQPAAATASDKHPSTAVTEWTSSAVFGSAPTSRRPGPPTPLIRRDVQPVGFIEGRRPVFTVRERAQHSIIARLRPASKGFGDAGVRLAWFAPR